jgi:serine/threonine-protein kinase RsbW
MSVISQDTEPVLSEETTVEPNLPATAYKEFTFPGDLQSIPASRERVMQYVREHCTDEADEIDLMIGLHEALVNAALHGCGNNPTKTIHCSVEIQPSRVCVVVRDSGSGFDFERIADPERFKTSTLERGRGIALMRGVVDEVTFACGGSEVRLMKRMKCHAVFPEPSE